MAKKQHHEEHENLERWLVSYADFITLLFAFFTILYALGQTDKAKYKNAIENIQRAFTSAGGIFPLKGTPFTPFDKPPDKGSQVPPGAQDAGKYSKAEEAALGRIAEQVRGIFERSTGLASESDEVDVVKTPSGFKIRLGEAMIFAPGSDKLKREQAPFLFEMGKRLANLNLPIQIEGHWDSGELTGRGPAAEKQAWDLASGRSYNIVKFLTDGTGFPKNLISMGVFGDNQPIASNDSPEGRAKNRRVEISITTPDKEIPELNW